MIHATLLRRKQCGAHGMYAASRPRAFFEDDGGFSTAGMAIALLLTLALVFTSAQVYRIHSTCANVQHVADVSALAAENQVASYYLAAQVCDAIVLSLSLVGILCTGAGIVALCVPAGQAVGEKLIEAGDKVLKARNRFSESASKGLDTLQQLLPFFAAAQAARVAHANNTSTSSFGAFAILLPLQGQQLANLDSDAADSLASQTHDKQEEIAQAATQAEEAAKRADACKQKAFEADCGANPAYCMYERASKLAGMSGSSNPLYTHVDAWTFSVALKRAQAYYPRRLAQETPHSSSIEEQGSSVLRRHFYAYACDEIRKGYVHETKTSFKAHFPLLPRNTSQMRKTVLYTQALYPMTVDDAGVHMMHAWPGCPVVQERGSIGNGSAQQCEAGAMPMCPRCEFSVTRLGKIAAASTSTANGFEHYYRIVAEEAQAYQKAREEQEDASQRVRDPVGDLLEKLKEAIDQAGKNRIEVHPPGSIGVVVAVVDTRGVSASSLIPSSFASSAGTLGTRAAISAATLALDDATETSNVLSSFFDGLKERVGTLMVLPSVATSLWGHALYAYMQGQHAIQNAIQDILNGLPLIGASGLGTWAADKIRDAVHRAGLQPVELSAYKPVLVNSYHVASADSSALAQGLIGAKGAYSHAIGSGTGNPLGVLVGVAGGQAQGAIDGMEDGIPIAHIQFVDGLGPGIDIRIPLPPAVKDGAQGLIESAVSAIQGVANTGGGLRQWE